jgi:DNA-binding response OmpR family regulator
VSQSAHLGWHLAHTITEAEQWLNAHTPEVVVLQISAANALGQGLALLSALAARTPAVPSLVITERDELGDRIQMAAAGVQSILTPPVTAAQLWQVTEQLWQRHRIQSVHLLAVDDDPILLDALHPMLEPWGMRLTTLSQPSQFWEVLRETSPDLLILDVEMPGFSGIELCQAVRTDVQWQDLPIVFLTAHRDAETVQQIFTAGADDYVTKPILGAELLTRITNRCPLRSCSWQSGLEAVGRQSTFGVTRRRGLRLLGAG